MKTPRVLPLLPVALLVVVAGCGSTTPSPTGPIVAATPTVATSPTPTVTPVATPAATPAPSAATPSATAAQPATAGWPVYHLDASAPAT